MTKINLDGLFSLLSSNYEPTPPRYYGTLADNIDAILAIDNYLRLEKELETMSLSHTTKTGDTLLIAEMSTTHIANHLTLIVGRCKDVVAQVATNQTGNDESKKEFMDNLYKGAKQLKKYTPKEAADFIRSEYIKMTPYLAELWVRQIEIGQDSSLRHHLDLILQDVHFLLGRSGQLNITKTILLDSGEDAPELE